MPSSQPPAHPSTQIPKRKPVPPSPRQIPKRKPLPTRSNPPTLIDADGHLVNRSNIITDEDLRLNNDGFVGDRTSSSLSSDIPTVTDGEDDEEDDDEDDGDEHISNTSSTPTATASDVPSDSQTRTDNAAYMEERLKTLFLGSASGPGPGQGSVEGREEAYFPGAGNDALQRRLKKESEENEGGSEESEGTVGGGGGEGGGGRDGDVQMQGVGRGEAGVGDAGGKGKGKERAREPRVIATFSGKAFV